DVGFTAFRADGRFTLEQGKWGSIDGTSPHSYNGTMGMKERLVRFHSFWIFPVLSIGLIFWSIRTGTQHSVTDVGWFIGYGLVFWTLLEYGFHRILLHSEIQNPLFRAFVNASHLRHHATPRDPNQILVQPSFA